MPLLLKASNFVKCNSEHADFTEIYHDTHNRVLLFSKLTLASKLGVGVTPFSLLCDWVCIHHNLFSKACQHTVAQQRINTYLDDRSATTAMILPRSAIFRHY